MATTQHNVPASKAPQLEDVRVGIVSCEWNAHINNMMVTSAVRALESHGIVKGDGYEVFYVPGAVELTFAASQLIEASAFDVIIVFGTVIRGGTPHFDYVCQSVTQGITQLNADVDTPVIFGVLTVDTEQDAIVRANGIVGNKGAECAETALKMVAFKRMVDEL